MKIIKEYSQIYPLEQFPLLKSFRDNLHNYSKGKDVYWEQFIKDHLDRGLEVTCRILDKHNDGRQPYIAYVSMVNGPEQDLFYIGFGCEKSEDDIIGMIESFSDDIFAIENWNKEDVQKFFINRLQVSDFEH